MTARRDETARLRRCRLLFEGALAERCSMEEARRREAEARWTAVERRLADRRSGIAADADVAEGVQPRWWQR